MSKIQSVLLKRKYFSRKLVYDWIKQYKFKSYKIDTTKTFFRFRQFDPSPYEQYRILKINEMVEFVFDFIFFISYFYIYINDR